MAKTNSETHNWKNLFLKSTDIWNNKGGEEDFVSEEQN